jgi:hypothetical protein
MSNPFVDPTGLDQAFAVAHPPALAARMHECWRAMAGIGRPPATRPLHSQSRRASPGYDGHRSYVHQRQAITNCNSYSRNYSSRIIGVKQMKHFSAQTEKQLKYESIINT